MPILGNFGEKEGFSAPPGAFRGSPEQGFYINPSRRGPAVPRGPGGENPRRPGAGYPPEEGQGVSP